MHLQNFKEVICENPLNFEEYNDVPFSKYFIADPITDTISMNQFLKNKPYYRKHDMVKEGNVFYRKFDIIICRNVLIYFNTNLQNRLFSMFNEALQKKGTLILGAHESILGIEGSKYIKHSYFYLKK